MTEAKRRTLSLRIVLLAGALALSVEFLLQRFKEASLCTAESCLVVGETLRFEEFYLVLLGAVFFWVLLAVAAAAERIQSERLWSLVLLILLAGLAFEGSLLGYQLSAFDSICWLCLSVSLWLLLSAALLAWRRQALLPALLCLAVGLAGTAAPNLLRFQPQSVSLEQTAFLEREPSQSGPSPELYLFFSLHCSHCSEVFANLALNRPWSADWNLCSIDSGGEDLARLAGAVQASKTGENVFIELLRAKQAEAERIEAEAPESLRRSTGRARAFFQARGYSAIPLLIAKEGPARQVLLLGSESIGKYLWERGLVRRWLSGPEIERRLKKGRP